MPRWIRWVDSAARCRGSDPPDDVCHVDNIRCAGHVSHGEPHWRIGCGSIQSRGISVLFDGLNHHSVLFKQMPLGGLRRTDWMICATQHLVHGMHRGREFSNHVAMRVRCMGPTDVARDAPHRWSGNQSMFCVNWNHANPVGKCHVCVGFPHPTGSSSEPLQFFVLRRAIEMLHGFDVGIVGQHPLSLHVRVLLQFESHPQCATFVSGTA